MKLTIMESSIGKIIVCLSFLLNMTIAAEAQTVYNGQIYVNADNIVRQGELLRVCMKVSYNSSVVGPCESLTFTPVLKTDSNMVWLSSVVINGKDMERDAHRTEKLSRKSRMNFPIVVKEKRAGKRYFNYDTTIPYEAWMQRSKMYVESEECNCNGRKGHTYEDIVLGNLNLHDLSNYGDTSVTSCDFLDYVQFLRPQGDEVDLYDRKGKISLTDYGRRKKMSGEKFNRCVFDSISVDIKNELQKYGTSLVALEIQGYGAPICN